MSHYISEMVQYSKIRHKKDFVRSVILETYADYVSFSWFRSRMTTAASKLHDQRGDLRYFRGTVSITSRFVVTARGDRVTEESEVTLAEFYRSLGYNPKTRKFKGKTLRAYLISKSGIE